MDDTTMTQRPLKENYSSRKPDREQGYKKAAEFLLSIEKEHSAKILPQLSDEEIKGIINEIKHIQGVDSKACRKIAAEFGFPDVCSRTTHDAQFLKYGGADAAYRLLETAFGEERARRILEKDTPHRAAAPFSFLQNASPENISSLVNDESALTIAILLRHLDQACAQMVLQLLSSEKQDEVREKSTQVDMILPEVVKRTADELEKKYLAQSDFSQETIDGKSCLKRIVKCMVFEQGKSLLESLAETEPHLAEELERGIFTFDIIRRITLRDLRKILHDFTDHDCALLMKGENDEIRAFIMSALPEHRKKYIHEERNMVKNAPSQEIHNAKKTMLNIIKSKINSGEIVLLRENDRIIS